MAFEYDEINSVLYLVETGKLRINVCDILSPQQDIYDETEGSVKISASESDIFFSTVIIPSMQVNHGIAMKIWIDWSSVPVKDDRKPKTAFKKDLYNYELFEALEYEAKVYHYITVNIILPGKCNNFIPFLAYGKCPITDIKQALQASTKIPHRNSLLDKLQEFDYIPSLTMCFLVTGSLKNKNKLPSLFTLLATTELSIHDIASIIFQMLYALYMMSLFRINHNDLHIKNILIEILDKPIEISIYGRSFTTKYIPKIFDFDHAYVEDLGSNPFMEFDKSFQSKLHGSNKLRNGADYYQFICGIINYPNVRTVLNPILPDPSFTLWQVTSNLQSYYIPILPDTAKNIDDTIPFYSHELINTIQMLTWPKDVFDKIIDPLSYTSLIPNEQLAHVNNASSIYFGYSKHNIILYSGWSCYPIYDPSSKILYPLHDLFNNVDLFEKMAQYLELFME